MGRELREGVMTGSRLQFDEERHVYTLDGNEVLSVTQILKVAGLMDSRWFNTESRDRGSYVAQATHFMDEGELDIESLDPALVPYCRAWSKFLSESRSEVIQSEYRVCNLTHGYAGTLDRWLVMNGKDTLIDIKTGTSAPWHPIQTAGYASCIRTHFTRGCVYLNDDGSYKLKLHKDASDYGVFGAALVVAQWKQKNGVIAT